MGYVSVKAITLGEYETLDKSKTIVAFADKLGKVKIKFKGVKTDSSRRSGYTYDFLLEKILLYKKNDKYTATELELLNPFEHAKSSYEKMQILSYIRELILAFLPEEQPDERTFELLLSTLDIMNSGVSERNAFAYFALSFFRLQGIPIRMPQRDSENFLFSPERGGFNVSKGAQVKREVVKEIEKFYSLNIIELRNFEFEHFSEVMSLIGMYAAYQGNSNRLTEFITAFEKLYLG